MHRIRSAATWLGCFCTLACAAPLLVTAAESSSHVSNSVSVSSSGSAAVEQRVEVHSSNGESHLNVETIIDGEVVESHEAHGSGTLTYDETVHRDNTASHVSATAHSGTNDAATRAQLQKLITRLETLIALYVTLLNT